ncbi:helix-turn-helix domain-containing protein [Brevibacillus formosus]|uniref:helix-turn-helix domain-containing protein n=1 Tax=Brevibacillus formosus TaxID=54913 RepID=UPI003F1C6E8F
MEQITREDFAEFVINMRTAAGLTRKGLAELIGVHENDVVSIEKECVRPTESVYLQIKKVVRDEINRKRTTKPNKWIILAR